LADKKLDRVFLDQRISTVAQNMPDELRSTDVLTLIKLSVIEDLCQDIENEVSVDRLSDGDVTSLATIKSDNILDGRISAKANGILAGLHLAEIIFKLVDPNITFVTHKAEGSPVEQGDFLVSVSGAGQSLLAAERVALNFLGRISGVATLTRRYVDAVAGTRAVILDTRKTAPGWRRLDKYAVCIGGGQNHRQGLYDMVLIKDNHIDGAGGITPAVESVRQKYGSEYPIEVEVKDLAELAEALVLDIDRIMLDNMSIDSMRKAVEMSAGRVPLEASGNVSLKTVRSIAKTGVDYISVGALTHSVQVFDVSMRLAGSD